MIQINNKLRDLVLDNANKHGFHDVEYTDKHYIMLIITELCEAINADRKDKHANIDIFNECLKHSVSYNGNNKNEKFKIWSVLFEREIKDTVEDELADAIIRILDFAGLKNIDIDSNNLKIGYINIDVNRSFADLLFPAVQKLTYNRAHIDMFINEVIGYIITVCEAYHIDIYWFIEQKMKYNETRERLHGRKY